MSVATVEGLEEYNKAKEAYLKRVSQKRNYPLVELKKMLKVHGEVRRLTQDWRQGNDQE